MAQNINVETARKILIDILKTLSAPENSKRILEAKSRLKHKNPSYHF